MSENHNGHCKEKASYFYSSKMRIFSISSLFDWDEINRNMNSIRWKDSHSKAIYRLRKRYRTLGKEVFDIINIVL